MSFRIVLVAVACLYVNSCLSAAQASLSHSNRKPSDSVEGVTEYVLPNGFHILLAPDISKPTITVNVTYLVGSRFESYGETGMAHLLEHMMFKGSQIHPHIPDEISKHGAQSDATTSYDRTNYFETFAASDDNLKWALAMEADRMVNSFIAKKDLDSEMTVVRNEFEQGENNPVHVLNERVLETAYIWHNYRHPTIGARSDIENMPIERLRAFYRKYYRPDNATLIVAGNFNEEKAVEFAQQTFGKLADPTGSLLTPYTREPTQDGQRDVVLRRAGDEQELIAAYHIPPDGHPDTLALALLARVLSDPASGVLRKELIDAKIATSANAGLMSEHDPGMIEFFVTVAQDGDLGAARKALLNIVQDISQHPISTEELAKARAEVLEEIERTTTDPTALAMALSESVADGDWRLFFWERDQLRTVTPADIKRVATKYLVPSNLTIGSFIPDEKPVRVEIPNVPDYRAVLKDYRGHAPLAEGEGFEATPANIEAHTLRSAVGNIKIAMLPKKTRGGLVDVWIAIHFGDENSLRNSTVTKQLLDAMLMRGTTKHDMAQLREALTQDKTEMSVSGGPTTVSVNFQTDREHFSAAMALAAEVLQCPSFPASEFDEIKSQMLAKLEAAKAEPQTLASTALRRALFPYPGGYVRYVPTVDESIQLVKATTLQDVTKLYQDLYGIGAAEMAFVGDFDPGAAQKEVSGLFLSWKSPAPYKRVPFEYKEVRADHKTIETPDKANAVFLAGTTLPLNDDSPSYAPLVLGNYIFGGGFLNSRLATRIRQQDGLSYTVGSDLTVQTLDKSGTFSIFAICAPQNEAKVERDFREELARVIAQGFTGTELSAAKLGYLQGQQVELSNDSDLATMLAADLYYGRDFRWLEELDAKISASTSDQVTAALRQYIDAGKFVTVAAGDFSKTQTQ